MSDPVVHEYTNDEIKRAFLSLQDGEQLAEMLGITLDILKKISNRGNSYREFSIPKRHGGIRLLASPKKDIKEVQRHLAHILATVYKTKPSAHGFLAGRSIVTNARYHVKKKFVLNIDLKDFFPTITWPRVYGMFKARPYFLPAEVARLLTDLCCHNGYLPQGAPTSPIISNMICAKMDSDLQHLAKSCKCVYTRYADDMTFSTYLSSLPRTLAYASEIGNQIEVSSELRGKIEGNGFELNPTKIRLSDRKHKQEVTGVIVNRKTNVPRIFMRQVRSMLNAWRKYGYDKAQARFIERYDYKHRESSENPDLFRCVVSGKIEYIRMVKGKEDSTYKTLFTQFRHLDSGEEDAETSATIAVSEDILYESGMEILRAKVNKKIDGSLLADYLNFENRLFVNIKKMRNYGDTSELKHDRNQIIDQLNRLTLDSVMNSVC